mgnify:CR=1 FL=1
MARTTPDKVELKRNIANIKKFLQREDCGMIDSGIELARSLDQESIFEEFLKDCKIYEGSLVRNKIFSGEASAQPYLDYALLNLIAYAPEKTNLNKSLKRSNIKSLNFYESIEWTELPSYISSFTSLTSLDLHNCNALQNVDGLANLTKLTNLDLSKCKSLMPKPSPVFMNTRQQVVTYQERIKKSMKK